MTVIIAMHVNCQINTSLLCKHRINVLFWISRKPRPRQPSLDYNYFGYTLENSQWCICSSLCNMEFCRTCLGNVSYFSYTTHQKDRLLYCSRLSLTLVYYLLISVVWYMLVLCDREIEGIFVFCLCFFLFIFSRFVLLICKI